MMKRFLPILIAAMVAGCVLPAVAADRCKYNFNSQWLLAVGDMAGAEQPGFDDSRWQPVVLPRAFNGEEAFARDIVDLTDTICWYRKHFSLSADELRGRVFVEFEGVRQGADVYLNGHYLGSSENGVMASGFLLSPHAREGENVLAVRCDNSWQYRSRLSGSRYQWNDRNFNANYGGIPKNVYLHVTPLLYQTLPLFSTLGTQGTYVYATRYDVGGRTAEVHVESEVRNDDSRERTIRLEVELCDARDSLVARFAGAATTLPPATTATLAASREVSNLHFWSWGYGYLYTVRTRLVEASGTTPADGADCVVTRTGFRQTRFGEGKIWLNDRVMMLHGYAQRSSNEWPGVGLSVPAWLSDYSNGLMVASGGNIVRWMHVTPWKQDIESCDRVGLPQAMPAGDAERDVEGERWQQRLDLMRDAIIYNRNNPSILFYECGNKAVSRQHLQQMQALRDRYDPHGGRAVGSREMLDVPESEYGGEMLYINKSARHPLWAMEYCRDEGLRKYWDAQSYPWHREGDGPLYRGQPAPDYNHNQDALAIELVRRWYDYWRERPGSGTRVSAGGAKIVFSDTNTHHRGESNYRTSGVVDAMRIPKDAFFAHQVMWSGWVDDEAERTHIFGHWNYEPGTVKTVGVVSTADSVQLLLNGQSLGMGQRSYHYLFTFPDVAWQAGQLEAVGYTGGQPTSHHVLLTAGRPVALRLNVQTSPQGWRADGADMALVEVEAVDAEGRRCPLDDRLLHFQLWGEGQWVGGIGTRDNTLWQRPDTLNREGLLDAAATKNTSDNYVGQMSLPLECGVCRVLLRSTPTAGSLSLSVWADGVRPAQVSLETMPAPSADGRSLWLASLALPGRLDRGETPAGPSYRDRLVSVPIASAEAGYDTEHARCSFDDNELTEWKNDGRLSTAWVRYQLERPAVVTDIGLKLTGWRLRSYPLEVYADNRLVWSGDTERSLGYIHLAPQPVEARTITLRLRGAGRDADAFGGIVEVAEPAAGELDLFKARGGSESKHELRIVEIDLLQAVQP